MAVRVVVVGTGGIARRHGEALADHEDAEIIGAIDIDRMKAEAFVGKFGGRVYADLSDVSIRQMPFTFSRRLDAHSYKMETDDFIDAILNGRKPLTNAWDGDEALRVSQAILESSRTGETVRIL